MTQEDRPHTLDDLDEIQRATGVDESIARIIVAIEQGEVSGDTEALSEDGK